MNYTNDTEQIVFIKDGDIVATLDGNTLSGNPVLSNGIPSFDLLSTLHQELTAYENNLSVYIRDVVGLSAQNLSTEISSVVTVVDGEGHKYSHLSVLELTNAEYNTLSQNDMLAENAIYVIKDSYTSMRGQQVKDVAEPTELSDAATKNYVDVNDESLRQYAESISTDVEELSGTVGKLIARDKKDVSYLGEVELKTEYKDPENEAVILDNTLFGLLLTNNNDRDRALHTGFMFKAISENHLSNFEITDGTNTQLFRDNDYLIVKNEVDAVKNVALSDVTVIKDYDLSVYLIQNQINNINLSIDGLDNDIAFLSSDLSSTVITHTVAVTDVRTVEEIVADDYSTTAWNTGDIFIVKRHIYDLADEDVPGTELENRYEYTAYVFNKSAGASGEWRAMDGNYSAENIYLTKDYTLDGDYTAVGNFLKSSKKIESKGKTLHWLLENMFDTTILPKLGAAPSFTIALTNNGTYEVGETITPRYTLTYSAGKYSYTWNNTTPADGTTLQQADVKSNQTGSPTDTKTTSVTNTAFSQSYKLTNGQTITLTASNVKYNQGAIPVDSKGVQHSDLRRAAGDLTAKTTSNSIVGKYRYFYAQSSFPTKTDGSGRLYIDGGDVNSDDVRALLSTKVFTIAAGSTAINTAAGMTQFAIACPGTSGINSIVVSQASPPIDLTMKKTDITIKDAGGSDVSYKLFYIVNGEAALNANTYTIKQIA